MKIVILIIILWNLLIYRKSNKLYCGIVGFSSNGNFNIDKIKMLFLYNEERGRDSTGFYTPEMGVVKNTDRSSTFVYKTKIKESGILIGHCRKSSMGYIKESNAHPFEVDNIVGVHNGHISNHLSLTTYDERNHFGIDIDSHSLFYLLSKYKDPRILYHVEGSVAIIFTDKRTKTIYAFRNTDRPLFYGKIKNDMYMSSIECSLIAIGCKNIKEFAEDYLYKIESGKIIKKLFLGNTEKMLKVTANNFKNGKYKVNSSLIAVGEKDMDGKDIQIVTKDSILDVKLYTGCKLPEFISPLNGKSYTINYKYLYRFIDPIDKNSLIEEVTENTDDIENVKQDQLDQNTLNNDDENISENTNNIFDDENVHPIINDAFNNIMQNIEVIIDKYTGKLQNETNTSADDMRTDIENVLIDTYDNTTILLENEV